ncbi:FecR family protein [Magnetococcus sp. PR-3]|uniref:FecR family protein n=1 Tax=Magnetococcus sp. PR-3 TaxID=3120355 RepID=UPI002FCE464B
MFTPLSSQAAVQAGRVLFMVGKATATDGQGQTRTLKRGEPLRDGDQIETGSGATVQIRFRDGATTALYSDTTFEIEAYRYEKPGDPKRKAFFKFKKGLLRTISGHIGKIEHARYRMETPVAVIGIRGTEYLAEVEKALTVSVVQGAVEIENEAGILRVEPGQNGWVPDAVSQPRMTPRRLRSLHKLPVTQKTAPAAPWQKGKEGMPVLPQAMREAMRQALQNQGVDVEKFERYLQQNGGENPENVTQALQAQGLDADKLKAQLQQQFNMTFKGPPPPTDRPQGMDMAVSPGMLAPPPPEVLEALAKGGLDQAQITALQQTLPTPDLFQDLHEGRITPEQMPKLLMAIGMSQAHMMSYLQQQGVDMDALHKKLEGTEGMPTPDQLIQALSEQGMDPKLLDGMMSQMAPSHEALMELLKQHNMDPEQFFLKGREHDQPIPPELMEKLFKQEMMLDRDLNEMPDHMQQALSDLGISISDFDSSRALAEHLEKSGSLPEFLDKIGAPPPAPPPASPSTP